MTLEQQNWAGNHTYQATRLHHPTTVEQVQELVRASTKVRVLGSRHSFNTIADSPEDLISLERLDPGVVIDPQQNSVTVPGGVRYGQLCEQLEQAGYALPNLASLPHISVAGACATATHGSGDQNGCLASSVAALKLVTADGNIIRLCRDKDVDQFAGAVVGLGGLGVVLELKLDLVPTFQVRQDVYENLPLTEFENHFDEITSSGYSVSFFTDWQQDRVNHIWLKRRVMEGQPFQAPSELYGATLATVNLHPISGLSAISCTEQRGIPGPWFERLPHFRMEFTPSNGEELQSEYLVPRQHVLTAIRAINGLRENLAPLLQISEIRTVAADDLWMSPFYKQPCVGLHFTWVKDWPAVKQLLPLLESELAPYSARPHWGKLFTMPTQRIQALYEKLPDFQRLLQSYDPEGKFRNAFVDQYVFGAA